MKRSLVVFWTENSEWTEENILIRKNYKAIYGPLRT